LCSNEHTDPHNSSRPTAPTGFISQTNRAGIAQALGFSALLNGGNTLARKSSSSIQVGDSFVKTGEIRKSVWVVTRSWTHVDGLLHVQLAKQARQSEIITVSATTLADGAYFRPIAQQPQ
jgi:hypothetical protein